MSAVLLSAQDQPCRGLQDFYRAVLPSNGHYCLLLLPEARHVWADSLENLVELTEKNHERTGVYFATAAYAEPTKRTQANVSMLKALRLDIDAGPAKLAKHGDEYVYATQDEALKDVVRFAKASALAPTLIVSSGAGLHIYYCLTEAVSPDVWMTLATALQDQGVAHGLKIDSTTTKDAARVLRPLGALHDNGERVAIRWKGKPWVLEVLAERLSVSTATPKRVYDTSINDDMAVRVEGPPSSMIKIAANCAAVHEVVACRGNVIEPFWRLTVGLAKHTAEGRDIAHDLSRGYPGYDPAETERKYNAYNAGPPTCAKFGEYTKACADCKHKGKIKSPIVLGRMNVVEVEALPPEKQPDLHPDLVRMNRDYFVAPDGAGKTCIFRESVNPETDSHRVTALTRAELILAHENEFVEIAKPDGGIVRAALASWWLKQLLRRQYPLGMALLPNIDAPPGVYNLWRGYGAVPTEGDVAPMLEHIEMMCRGALELVAYVVLWLAFCVQHPGGRPEVALVFRGGQGTGKGTLLRLMAKLFGSHALHITQQSHLVGNFNAHLRSALFVFVDEGYWAGDKSGEGVLKGLITEPTIAIEMKGRDVFTAPNRLKLCMASNSAWVIPAGTDERRYCVIDVPDTRAKDHAYFDALNKWIDEGGAGAWLHHLLHLDTSGFNPRAAPSTAALDQQKIENLPPLDRWILEALHQGTSLAGEDWPADGDDLVCSMAVGRFADYCQRAGGRHSRADARVVGARLDRVFGCGPSRTVQGKHGSRPKAWKLPGLDRARALAAAAFGLQHSKWN